MSAPNNKPLTARQRKLAGDNYGLSVRIAKHLAGRWPFRAVRPTREEIQEAAHQAVVCAARKFDPSRRVRFGTYLRAWVRAKLQRTIEYGRDRARRYDAVAMSHMAQARVAEPTPAAAEIIEQFLTPQASAVANDRDRVAAMVRGYFLDGLTYRELGEQHGVSHQRAQALVALWVDRNQAGLAAACARAGLAS